MKKVSMFTAIAILAGCASNENQIRQTLEKNPDLVFDVIAKNPEKFIEVVNKAAQQAQRNEYEKRVAQAQAERDGDLKILKNQPWITTVIYSGRQTHRLRLLNTRTFNALRVRWLISL